MAWDIAGWHCTSAQKRNRSVSSYQYSDTLTYNQEIKLEESMRVILQRVSRASVTVDGQITGEIARGFVALVGIRAGDTESEAQVLAHKTAHLRVFADDAGKMNLSALDAGAAVLVVSQFTLYADVRKGRRPSFTGAAKPDVAEPLVARYADHLQQAGIVDIAQGVFGANMQVEIHNDGPVTIILDSDDLGK